VQHVVLEILQLTYAYNFLSHIMKTKNQLQFRQCVHWTQHAKKK